MEMLKFTEQKNRNRWNYVLEEMTLALLVSVGLYACLRDMFDLRFIFRQGNSPAKGLIHVWNQIADVLGSTSYILLPKFEGGSAGNGVFLVVAFVFLTLVFFCFIRSRNGWSMLGIFLLPATLCGICGLRITWFSALLFEGSIVAALIYMRESRRNALGAMLFTTVVVAMTAAVFSLPGAERLANRSGLVKNVHETVSEKIADWYYGENPLQSGDLTQRERIKEDEEAFQITMSKPQSVYLRGFVGDRYQKDRWETLTEQTYYETRNLCYWLHQSGFETLGQLGQAQKLASDEKAQDEHIFMNMKVTGADTRHAYIPYEIHGTVEHGKSWGGNFVTPTKFERLVSYRYESGENAVKSWTDTAANIFVRSGIGIGENNAGLETYLVNESYYNTYVYENFTYVSKEDQLLLRKEIGEPGDQSKGHIDYKTAISGIRNYLEQQFLYTEYLGPAMDEYQGALEEFFSTKKGYDVQFATAAVMMFRYYGIPARYVEGYLITPQDVENMQPGEAYAVSKSQNHAWPEIYIDGTGFVPIEVCPTYRGVMEEADMEVGISNNTLLRPFEQEEGVHSLPQSLTMGGEDDRQVAFPVKLWLFALLVFFLFLVAVWGIKHFFGKLRKWFHRRRRFYKATPKIAVSAIYQEIEMRGYPVSEEVRLLGNKAAYSRMEMTEEERGRMLMAWKLVRKESSRRDGKKKT